MSDQEKQTLLRLQRLCARAEYCTSDIRRKALKALEGDAEGAGRVVAALLADRFVDDRRYAAAFAREKSALQGWGPVKIRYQLRAKGIAPETVDEALREVEPQQASARMEKFLADRYRTLKDDPRWRPKLIRAALSRGYGYDQAVEAVDRLSTSD